MEYLHEEDLKLPQDMLSLFKGRNYDRHGERHWGDNCGPQLILKQNDSNEYAYAKDKAEAKTTIKYYDYPS